MLLMLAKRSVALTIFALFLATLSPGNAQAQIPRHPLFVYQEHIDAVNRGDAAAAAAVFTDDGVFVISGCPAGTGCVGRTAIQARIQASINGNARITTVSVQQNNNIITAVEEHRADPIRAAGVERAVFKVTLTFTGDKISRRVVEPDLSDPQTARFATPAPATPAVSPPQTGDGGLLSESRARTNRTALAALIALFLLSAAGLSGVELRRRRANLG